MFKILDVLRYALQKRPIVPAITHETDLDEVANSNANVAFILDCNIITIKDMVDKLQDSNKLVFVHLDLMSGIARDKSGVRFLAERIGIDGIVTTRSNLVSLAKQHDLMTIQRTFILDSVSIDQTIKTMHTSCPDAVEILPGLVIPLVMHLLKPSKQTPIIAGGLLSAKEDVKKALDCGCLGVSTSSTVLWKWQNANFTD